MRKTVATGTLVSYIHLVSAGYVLYHEVFEIEVSSNGACGFVVVFFPTSYRTGMQSRGAATVADLLALVDERRAMLPNWQLQCVMSSLRSDIQHCLQEMAVSIQRGMA